MAISHERGAASLKGDVLRLSELAVGELEYFFAHGASLVSSFFLSWGFLNRLWLFSFLASA